MDRNFGGVVWTNHALERLRERGIKQGDAWATWRNPDQSRSGTVTGSWVYYRNWNGTQIEVVAKHMPAQAGNAKRDWLILSVWSRPASQLNVGRSFWRKLYNFLFSK
ncbi:MAG TPA: DUF4258 domain-containing protein [Patescibacteria group bacterium]|nr:DUF4258 domain-containing protein [Patescibacteria group bacterium]